MTFNQSANYNWRSLVSLVTEFNLQRIQNWIRQEIVDNDPYDPETFFPHVSTINSAESN